MAQFKLNQPVVQAEPLVKVEVPQGEPLPIGANRFRLVVVDDDGVESEPTFLDVIVQAPAAPTAVLDTVDENNGRLDPVVPFGKGFNLSGARSSDVDPGKVVEWRFTLVDRV
jgi:hypothetical protein